MKAESIEQIDRCTVCNEIAHEPVLCVACNHVMCDGCAVWCCDEDDEDCGDWFCEECSHEG